ncbi:MAG: sulfite exporter TauE/SafE family protein [Nitrospinae bacterium]|nr:sulfite exporter TauE/SafE family protein [Nitrospinota bacterium]
MTYLEKEIVLDWIGAGLLVLGAVVGTLNAATGVGWGIIMVPVLFLIPGLTPQQAVAVSIFAYLFNSLVASFENVRSGLIVWNYAVYLSIGAIVGGVLGAHLLQTFSALTLKRIVGALVIAAGANLLINR